MTKISIIISSRVQGNINHSLIGLLESLKIQTSNYSNIEVLVKFDYDDSQADDVVSEIKCKQYPFYIHTIKGDRNRGYSDIHGGYNALLGHVNPVSKVIVAMADDFTVEPQWDAKLLAQAIGDFFVIHQRHHPYIYIKDGYESVFLRDNPKIPMFDMRFDMFDSRDLHVIDEAPAWSKKLIDTVIDFPVPFTDAWTLCLEYSLWNVHKINITKFLPELIINRKTCEVDFSGDPRWGKDRKENFDFINSSTFRSIVGTQAKMIADKITDNTGRI